MHDEVVVIRHDCVRTDGRFLLHASPALLTSLWSSTANINDSFVSRSNTHTLRFE
jgi:hypothetical protein